MRTSYLENRLGAPAKLVSGRNWVNYDVKGAQRMGVRRTRLPMVIHDDVFFFHFGKNHLYPAVGTEVLPKVSAVGSLTHSYLRRRGRKERGKGI